MNLARPGEARAPRRRIPLTQRGRRLRLPLAGDAAKASEISISRVHLAAAEGQLEVVRYLLAAGADPRPADRWGGTPLSDAEGNGHTEIAGLLRQHAEQATPLLHDSDKREAAAI